jgi:vanillate O-demethylase ferredoxin subunit
MKVRVARKRMVAQEVCLFDLTSLDGSDLQPFTAGAHIDVMPAPGITRQYSLCNSPGQRRTYQIAVLKTKDSRGGSSAMHLQVQEGDTLEIAGPRNLFELRPAKKTLLIAGGIGITPIMSMAEHLSAAGCDFELHYCGRSKESMAFRDRLALAPYDHRVHFYTDDGGDGATLDLLRLLSAHEAEDRLYVCGPSGLIGWVMDTAHQAGWHKDNVHREFFGATPALKNANAAFVVRIRSTGQDIPVVAHQTITQALAAAGVAVETSCEQGVCGTCLTRVEAGLPDHRDSYLTTEEKQSNRVMTPCCSRSFSPLLVLEL